MLCILRFSVTKESIVWEVLATNRNIRAGRLVIDFFSAVLLAFDSYKKEEDGANGVVVDDWNNKTTINKNPSLNSTNSG